MSRGTNMRETGPVRICWGLAYSSIPFLPFATECLKETRLRREQKGWRSLLLESIQRAAAAAGSAYANLQRISLNSSPAYLLRCFRLVLTGNTRRQRVTSIDRPILLTHSV